MSAKCKPAKQDAQTAKVPPEGRTKSANRRNPVVDEQAPKQGLRTNKPHDVGKAPQGQTRCIGTRIASKQQLVVEMLSAAEGTSIPELMAATNWLPHSTRAVLSRLRKDGYRLDRQRTEGGTRYRITDKPAALGRA
jgi:hypothetical protein